MLKIKFILILFLVFVSSCMKENRGEKTLHSNNNYFKVTEVNYFETEELLPEPELVQLWKTDNKKKKSGEYLSFGINPNYVYIFFSVEREDISDWILEIPYPPIKLLHFYQVDQNNHIILQKSGIGIPSEEKFSEHPFYQFPLTKEIGLIKICLILKADDPLTTPILFWKQNYLSQIDGYRHLGFGFFFGIIVSLALYNFLLFLTIQDRTYLYYVFYILFFEMFLLLMYGYAGYLYRDLLVQFNTRFIPLFAILTSVFACLFSRRFLNVFLFSPFLNRLFQWLIAIGLFSVLVYFLIPQKVNVLIANIHPLFSASLIVPASIIAIKNNYKPAIYFIVAWTGLLISVTLYIGSNLSIFPSNFYTNYMQIPGVAFEAILLSLALGFRINDLRLREEEAKQETLLKEIVAREQQEKLSKSFKRFVPGEFLKNLNKESILDINQGDSISCKMSVLFTDIRGFTLLSEKLEPEKVFTFLNQYLETMEPIIQKYDGFIDKFIGDAIMALFPDEEKSILAGIEMLEVSSHFSLPDSSLLEIGIGIHSGELILGTIGSPSRLDTTVIGDTVNLASRIESLNKQYGTKILVSEDVVLSSKNTILLREIDLVKVKGKEKPILVYEVLGRF